MNHRFETTIRGFTLIELLVVVAIIALLIAILLPSLARARIVAKRVVCGTQQRQLATAMHAYAAENRGMFPATMDENGEGPQHSTVLNAWGRDRVLPFVKTYLADELEVLFCPGYVANNTQYYTTPEGFFEFSNGWRSWMSIRRITGYFWGTASILDPDTTPRSGFTYPNGEQRLVNAGGAQPGDVLLADVMLSVTPVYMDYASNAGDEA